MEPQDVEALMRQLIDMAANQHAINREQGAINERLTAAIERIDRTTERLEVTLSAIKDLLERGQNGR